MPQKGPALPGGRDAIEETAEKVASKAALKGGAKTFLSRVPYLNLAFGGYDAYQGYKAAGEEAPLGEKVYSAGKQVVRSVTGMETGKAIYDTAQEKGWTRPAEDLIDKMFGNDPNESYDKLVAANEAKKNAALKGSGYTATGAMYKAPDGKVVAAKDLPPELKGKLNALKIPGLNIPDAIKPKPPGPTPAKPSAPPPKAADTVTTGSATNAAARDQKGVNVPIVVNSPSSTNIQQTSNYAPKYPARNSDSSIQQYNKSRLGY